MLDSLKISNYNEHELWFRLLVMHVYHAGAYNVQKAVYACNPCEGNMELVYSLWRTQTKRFTLNLWKVARVGNSGFDKLNLRSSFQNLS